MNLSIPLAVNHMPPAKHNLRALMKERRASVTGEQAQEKSEAAAHLFRDYARSVFPKSPRGIVALYSKISEELSPAPLLPLLLEDGWTVVLPRMQSGSRILTFHRIDDQTELTLGSFRVPEPPAQCPQVCTEQIDLILVPGLAFSRAGARLGWGQGYYDSTLAKNPRALRVGYAFECQITDQIPMRRGDEWMNAIITESFIHTCE